MNQKNKLWAGVFNEKTDVSVENFTASINFDQALYQEDIACSIAHVKMLNKQKIIPANKQKKIIDALLKIRKKIEQGKMHFQNSQEDIHLAIESELFKLIGKDAGYLHTGRSRNDLVATDLRLYCLVSTKQIINQVVALRKAIIEIAQEQKDTVFPGYTHLQPAQPVLLAHHLLAYESMLQRDTDRFLNAMDRANSMPLASGALAGSGYNFDRDFLAKELGFQSLTSNSMDAVSDRDFVIDLHSSIATCMVHLSRISEEIIIWASKEFGLVSINDKYATGSSIMPQKKNPDVAELVRGKSARTIGNLVQILTLMKGLPLTYNRDLQEDKEPLFDSINTVINSLSITKGLLKALTFNKKTAENLAIGGYSLATDIADYLTIKGIPFRESHNIVGKIVQYCIKKNLSFSELSLDEYKQFSEKFNKDILDLDARQSLRNRNLLGGTSPQQVQKALKKAEVQLNKFIKKIKL